MPIPTSDFAAFWWRMSLYRRQSPEANLKRSEANRGKHAAPTWAWTLSPEKERERREKIRKTLLGHSVSPETRKKLSIASTGQPHEAWNKGEKMSDEFRLKQRIHFLALMKEKGWVATPGKDWTPESWSWLERKFEILLKEMRLLNYQHNYKVELEEENRVFYIDFAFPSVMLGIEVDSRAYHSTTFAKSKDRDRQDLLEGAGWTLIRFRSEEILRKPDAVKKEIRKVVGETARKSLSTLG